MKSRSIISTGGKQKIIKNQFDQFNPVPYPWSGPVFQKTEHITKFALLLFLKKVLKKTTNKLDIETIIRIRKNKPAYKALILLARELRKNDESSIVISESYSQDDFDIISPLAQNAIPDSIFDELSDFPSIEELRKQAWPKS